MLSVSNQIAYASTSVLPAAKHPATLDRNSEPVSVPTSAQRNAARKIVGAVVPAELASEGVGHEPVFRGAGDAWRDAFEIIRERNPNIASALRVHQQRLFDSDEVKKCGADFMSRNRQAFFLFQTDMAIDVVSDAAKLRVVPYLPDGSDEQLGDQEFRSCFTRAVGSASVLCPRCPAARITAPWATVQAFAPPVDEAPSNEAGDSAKPNPSVRQ